MPRFGTPLENRLPLLADDRRDGHARRHEADSDIVLEGVLLQRTHEPDDAVLRGRVVCGAGGGQVAREAGDEDDGAAGAEDPGVGIVVLRVIFPQGPDREADGQSRGVEVDCEGPAVGFG